MKHRYINLGEADLKKVTQLYEKSNKHHVREKCHALLLSHAGYKAEDIAKILNKETNTLYQWYNSWESNKEAGLEIKPGRGRPSTIDLSDPDMVELIKKNRRTATKNNRKLG